MAPRPKALSKVAAKKPKSLPPRKAKGVLTKKQQTFLATLEDKYGFSPSKEWMESYTTKKALFTELFNRYLDKRSRYAMEDEEKDLLWKLNASLENALALAIKYCYPTMKATEVSGASGTQPVFNFVIGGLPAIDMKSAGQIIDITPQRPAPIRIEHKE